MPSCNSTENLKRLIHSSKNKQTPATNHSLVDLLCNSYEVCVSLFLFLSSLLLINYSQNELNKRSYKLMKSKQLTKSHQPIIYEKLIKLKQDFFRLTNYILKSINFSTSSINFDVESSTNQNAYDLLSSLSTSSTPYSTLKILNTVLDSLNHLIYLPVLNQQSDPNSIITWFYFRYIFQTTHYIIVTCRNVPHVCYLPIHLFHFIKVLPTISTIFSGKESILTNWLNCTKRPTRTNPTWKWTKTWQLTVTSLW